MRRQFELSPGAGGNGLLLGASKDDVRRSFGAPDEEEYVENEYVRWWYGYLEMNVYFECEYRLRMSLVETSSVAAILWDAIVIGLAVEDLLELFQKKGYASPEITDQGTGEVLYSYPGCDVYTQAETVTSIQITILFDEAGDNELWPT